MILELHGFPGSGKTTVLTMIAQRALQGKSTLDIPVSRDTSVYTSFYCQGCYKFDPFDCGKYDMSNSLILLDEISLYFDNRQFASFTRTWLEFFKLHRHANINLVYCSQSARDADLKIRTLVEKSYIIDPYPFGFTALKPIIKSHTVVKGEPGEHYELAPPIMWHWCYRPKYYKYFDSYETKPLPPVEKKLWEKA